MSDFAVKRRSLNTIHTYSGTYELYGTASKGYMILKDSGTLTFKTRKEVDVFLLGGGGAGCKHYDYGWGGAGGSGYTKTILARNITAGDVTVTIGAGGVGGTSGQSRPFTANSGGYTQFGDSASDKANGGLGGVFNKSVQNRGGDGGSGGGGGAWNENENETPGGAGGTNGSDGANGLGDGGTGQHTTTKAFEGDVAPFDNMLYATGGSGLISGTAGAANTGDGGSSGYSYYPSGGSGVCIVRWGY